MFASITRAIALATVLLSVIAVSNAAPTTFPPISIPPGDGHGAPCGKPFVCT
ncbi:hypothetical protein OBBRIDRAFT_793147 [Obba rivulosa]|uniref:Uncharacterized protein n=1 Tax=Obba rivulosa TaxID=1052685 RepID=A0A8E2AUI5_9APHY|nr:hypothetical protein OBBRIDRAFT_793147 [Obba rivulosa]